MQVVNTKSKRTCSNGEPREWKTNTRLCSNRFAEAIHTIKWHAELIDKIYDKTAPSGDDALSIILREPIV